EQSGNDEELRGKADNSLVVTDYLGQILVEDRKNNGTDQHKNNNQVIRNGSKLLYTHHVASTITMTGLNRCRRSDTTCHHIGHSSQSNSHLMAGLFHRADLSGNKRCRRKGPYLKYILHRHRGADFKNALDSRKLRVKKGKCLCV